MIKADGEGWKASVKHHIQEGANFLLILPKDRKHIESFCRMFGLPADCQPKNLTRSGFFSLSQFMEPEVFDEVLGNWNEESNVVFVEQLDFPVNRPPRLQNFLVYSHVLGILAQAPSMSLAKEALADYEGSSTSALPDASIYVWQKSKWQLYEGR